MYGQSTFRDVFLAACALCAIAITLAGIGVRAGAPTGSNDLSFEAATVKPVDPSYRFDGKHFWAHVSPARASYWYMTLANLITYAYDLKPFQVTSPEWANADHFDIEAKFPEGADKKDDRRMLQALLKERFRLAFHIEKRELEGYVLIVGKHGEKLRPSPTDQATPKTDAALKSGDGNAGDGHAKAKLIKHADGSSTVNMGTRGTQTIKFDQEHSAMHFEESKMTMEGLAVRISGCLGDRGHKVVDETGIKGNYQVAYNCPMPGLQRPAATDTAGTLPTDPQGSYMLIQSLDALGLKLEKRKMLMDVYVIDHAEQPSTN